MKISLEWLKDYVALPQSADALAEALTKGGTEVVGREGRGEIPDKVVVAQILSSGQHPNADRLSVCQVDDGSGQPRQIVCGAKNYQVGDKVPLALPGAVLGPDFKIKSGNIIFNVDLNFIKQTDINDCSIRRQLITKYRRLNISGQDLNFCWITQQSESVISNQVDL